MRRRARAIPLVTLLLFCTSVPAFTSDRIQRLIAAGETLVPIVLLVAQGTDDSLEIGAFASSVLLQTAPNVVMLYAESTARPQLTRIMRWVNFGVDSGLATGLLAVGIGYLAGAFGQDPDTRWRGSVYLALCIPAGVAAFADFLPYAVESVGQAGNSP